MRSGDGREYWARLVGVALAMSQVGPAAPVMSQMIEPATANDPRPGSPRRLHMPQRLFLSGHSLTDHPFPEYLKLIAAALGQPIEWNMQGLAGSSVKDRTIGSGLTAWAGYRAGTDKTDQPLDVLAELQTPHTIGNLPYDTLIITEQHSLLDSIVRNDTMRYLRDFHDRVIGNDAQAQTYLFEAWMTVSNMDDPSSWIAYEWAATPVWQCVANRINHDLADIGRPDRLMTIPAGAALAVLVEQAISPQSIPGFEGRDTRSTLALIFQDDVHLTAAGAYYIALVTSAILHGRTVQMTDRPYGMRQDTADQLQQIAWNFVANHAGEWRSRTPDACRAYVSERFTPLYLAYQRDLQWRRHPSAKVWLRWAKLRLLWPRLFRRYDTSNPFHMSQPSIPVL